MLKIKNKLTKRWAVMYPINILAFSLVAMAQEEGVPVVENAADIPVDAFFAQVLELVKEFGGMPWTLKIAAIIMLIVSSMKVSFFRPLWDKIGNFKSIVAPFLGLFAGVISLGKDLSFAAAIAYMFSGAGAIVLHELLDSVKNFPGLGKIYVSVIDFIEKILKKPEKK